MNRRFSVLLPTHNRADVLPLAIRSVLAQTETDFEILVVGDGCTDNTADIVNGFGDPRIRWFDLPKAPGFGYANRNVALREAKGEYIAFMAHDDLVTPDHLALLAEGLERDGAEWIYSRPLWVSPQGVLVPYAVNLHNPSDLEVFLNRQNLVPASCILYRRACLDRYGYWPEDIERKGDRQYWRRIIQGGGGKNFAYCSTPTALHFIADWRKGQTSREAATLFAFAGTSPWWPPSLRIPIPEGVAEQDVYWSAMSQGGPAWIHRMRADIGLVLDYLAWSSAVLLQPGIAKDAAEYAAQVGAVQRECKERLNKAALKRQRLEADYQLRLQRSQAELDELKQGLRSLIESLSAGRGGD